MTKQYPDLDAYERDIVANATNWSTVCRLGPFDKRRADFATKADAIATAETDAALIGRCVLIYATDARNHDTLFGYVYPDGVLKQVVAA